MRHQFDSLDRALSRSRPARRDIFTCVLHAGPRCWACSSEQCGMRSSAHGSWLPGHSREGVHRGAGRVSQSCARSRSRSAPRRPGRRASASGSAVVRDRPDPTSRPGPTRRYVRAENTMPMSKRPRRFVTARRLARKAAPRRRPTERNGRFSSSLRAGLAILNCFSAEQPVLGIANLADELSMSRSTTHRYASTLVALGYLEQDQARRYRLAPRVVDVGMSVLDSMALRGKAREHLRELREQTGRTVSLAVLDGEDVRYVDRLRGWRRGQHAVDLNLGVGARVPANCSAMGKVLLAYLPEREREQADRRAGARAARAEQHHQQTSFARRARAGARRWPGARRRRAGSRGAHACGSGDSDPTARWSPRSASRCRPTRSRPEELAEVLGRAAACRGEAHLRCAGASERARRR